MDTAGLGQMVADRYHLPMPPTADPAVGRPPSLARRPAYLATQVSKAALRLLTDAFAEHDVRPAHFGVLATLDDLGALCQRDLCDRLDIDKSHMVGFVDDLEGRGLVDRERDDADRRRYRVAISPAGRVLLADLRRVHAASQAPLFGHLSSEQVETLAELLGSVVQRADLLRLGPAEPANTDADDALEGVSS
jgi:DNA-binding MarR family transcriptional regulator